MCPARIIAAVGPLLFIVLGLVALGGGMLVLRSFGSRYRIGRLLAATPVVSVAEARELAAGPARYVAIQGRIDAEDEFEDDAHRPLVLRRARIQLRRGSDWVTVDEHTTAVDFDVREGLDAIAVDHAALDDGLVVVPRESVGTAADAPDRVPAGTPPDAPTRLLVEQVSSVEHAIVLGVPTAGPDDGPVRMTAGLGRPLILTTLETPEAMRLLAAGGPAPAADRGAGPRARVRVADHRDRVGPPRRVRHDRAGRLPGAERRRRGSALERPGSGPGRRPAVRGRPRRGDRPRGDGGDHRLRAPDGRPPPLIRPRGRDVVPSDCAGRWDHRPIGKNCELGSLRQ